MTSDSALPPVIGATAIDRDGNTLGTVTTVFLDDVTERPTWVGLSDGPQASPEVAPVIAPIADARLTEGRLLLPVAADAVRSAPRVSRPDRADAARHPAHPEPRPTQGTHPDRGTRRGTTDTVSDRDR